MAASGTEVACFLSIISKYTEDDDESAAAARTAAMPTVADCPLCDVPLDPAPCKSDTSTPPVHSSKSAIHCDSFSRRPRMMREKRAVKTVFDW